MIYNILKLIITLIITPILMLIGLGVITFTIHETIWNNKGWKNDTK